jgi:hypothetical protein
VKVRAHCFGGLDREVGFRLWDACGLWVLEFSVWRWRLGVSFRTRK